MLKFIKKLINTVKKNEKGFTLVELMVVVVIIGVLVAIAVPVFGTVTRNAANRAHEANLRTLAGAANMHISVVGRGSASAGTFTGTDAATNALLGYVQTWPTVPDDAHGALDPGFPVEVTGTANDANADGTYTVTITPAGEVSIQIADGA
jgi:type IV pilus assembly protein PilA